MIIKAQQKNLPVTPKKMHLVVNAVKNMKPQAAVELLESYNKKSAQHLAKTIKMAISNATNNANLPADSLRFSQILMGRGLTMKRFHAGARGRAKPYQKTRSNLTVLLESVTPVVSRPKKVELPATTTPDAPAKTEKKVTKTTKKTK